ncbi:unnamed protein product [Eretmochelys imbricata]
MFWCGKRDTNIPPRGSGKTPRCAFRSSSPPLEPSALGCLRAVSGSGGDCSVPAHSSLPGRGHVEGLRCRAGSSQLLVRISPMRLWRGVPRSLSPARASLNETAETTSEEGTSSTT